MKVNKRVKNKRTLPIYKDVETGELLIKVSDWEIHGGKKIAYFQAKSGAIFSMYSEDVEKVK